VNQTSSWVKMMNILSRQRPPSARPCALPCVRRAGYTTSIDHGKTAQMPEPFRGHTSALDPVLGVGLPGCSFSMRINQDRSCRRARYVSEYPGQMPHHQQRPRKQPGRSGRAGLRCKTRSKKSACFRAFAAKNCPGKRGVQVALFIRPGQPVDFDPRV
jgi:hypothetical protein